LGRCGNAEVLLSVVQAIVIDMVGDIAIRYMDNLILHRYALTFLRGLWPLASDCIEDITVSGSVPCIFVKAHIIIGVNDSIFVLRKGYSAKGVAVTQPTRQEYQLDEQLIQTSRNVYFDVTFDDPTSKTQ